MCKLPDDIEERFFVENPPVKTGDSLSFTIICQYTKEGEGGPAPRIRRWRTTWIIRGTELDRMGETGIAAMREQYVSELKKNIRRALRDQNSHLEIKGEQLWLIPNEAED